MNKIKEAIKQLEGLKERCESMHEIYDCADFARDIVAIDAVIDEMTTIEAEPVRHGRNVTTMNPADYFVCSECGICLTDYLSVKEDDVRCEYKIKYCPECGAKMDLED